MNEGRKTNLGGKPLGEHPVRSTRILGDQLLLLREMSSPYLRLVLISMELLAVKQDQLER